MVCNGTRKLLTIEMLRNKCAIVRYARMLAGNNHQYSTLIWGFHTHDYAERRFCNRSGELFFQIHLYIEYTKH